MITTQDLDESQKTLDGLFEEVSSLESTLSGGKAVAVGSNAIKSLRDTKVSFGNPSNNLIRLTEKLFKDVGAGLTEIHKLQMREQFDFYYMTIALSMQPGQGVEFKRIECSLNLGPKGKEEPVIQAIFPKGEWRELLSLGAGLNIGLKGNLDWGVEVDPIILQSIPHFPGQLEANIINKNKLNAFITTPNYTFRLGNTHIVATGEGNSECFWRIEKPELKSGQTIQFGLVFKVPKGQKSITLTALAAVEPNINWLLGTLCNVYEYLSDTLKQLFILKDEERTRKARLPIGIYEQWSIQLSS